MEPELERLQGQWIQIAFEENGIPDPADTHGAPGAVMTVTGRRFHVAVPGAEALVEGSFKLDPAHYPKHIDWIDSIGDDAGKTIPAIYELKGDSFKFAAADPGMSRPDGFAGGHGITIRAFVRLAQPSA